MKRIKGFYYILLDAGITIAAWKPSKKQWYICGETEGFTDDDIECVLCPAPDITDAMNAWKHKIEKK